MENDTEKTQRHQAPGRADREGLSVIELFQMFPDDASARKWLEEMRWPNGQRHCPNCGSLKTKTVPNENPMPYHCGDCRKYFSVQTGTVNNGATKRLLSAFLSVTVTSALPISKSKMRQIWFARMSALIMQSS